MFNLVQHSNNAFKYQQMLDFKRYTFFRDTLYNNGTKDRKRLNKNAYQKLIFFPLFKVKTNHVLTSFNRVVSRINTTNVGFKPDTSLVYKQTLLI